MEYVSGWSCNGPPETVADTMATSHSGRTKVASDELLFEATISSKVPLTATRLVIAPPTVGTTAIVMLARAPLLRLFNRQVTTLPEFEQLPWLEDAEMKFTEGGKVSTTVALELAGP